MRVIVLLHDGHELTFSCETSTLSVGINNDVELEVYTITPENKHAKKAIGAAFTIVDEIYNPHKAPVYTIVDHDSKLEQCVKTNLVRCLIRYEELSA